MNLRQAVVEVMYLLTRSDGKIMKEELDVMDKYVKAKFPDAYATYPNEHVWDDWDIWSGIEELAIMPWEKRYARFENDLEILKASLRQDECTEILEYALRLVISDRELSQNEMAYVDCIGKVWGTDAVVQINQRLGI